MLLIVNCATGKKLPDILAKALCNKLKEINLVLKQSTG